MPASDWADAPSGPGDYYFRDHLHENEIRILSVLENPYAGPRLAIAQASGLLDPAKPKGDWFGPIPGPAALQATERALAFYGDDRTYRHVTNLTDEEMSVPAPIHVKHYGEIARAALETLRRRDA